MSGHLKKLMLTYSFIFSTLLAVQAQQYQISLLTCDPGDELYSAFGHSAIRLVDSERGQDLVFNYGTFNFATPNFYLKFTQRTLDYLLSVTTYERFLEEYQYNRRDVREQILDLNEEQKEELVHLLEINYLPQNRAYRYDFFYDNCATRIRDLFEIVLDKQLQWNDMPQTEEMTFRNLIDEYVLRMPWADFGIDLALGSVIDKAATEREKQFLPHYMERAFANATIEGDGPTRPLVKDKRIVLDFPDRQDTMGLFNPYLVLWLIAIIYIFITYLGYKKKRLFIGFDIGLFGLLGILGLVITILWFFTFHSQTKYNWNILWAFPLHLVLLYGLQQARPAVWVRKYLFFALIMADVAVVFWILGWQSFHPSLIPLLLVIILRTNFLYYNLEKFKREKIT